MNNENINNKDVSRKNIDKFSNVVKPLTTSLVSRKTNQQHSIDKNTLGEKIKCSSKYATCYKLKDTGEMHLRVQTYLEKKKISKLFDFLIGHLLVEGSPDPIQYLEKLLKECLLYRSGVKEPPLLFKTRHIRSIFQSLGPDNCNTISLNKYITGMIILGISDYEPNPFECMPGHVDWHTFKTEARRCLEKSLDDIIGKNDIL
ncbi:EF-hand calcium-binding domain-containing protein 10-like [Vespula squamosa]|uniref:EF-hand calcium-binding domain-containing protein 10-like n=1 Tax=Vespula squamosa TaxID=30214 RepID=A0ABD2BMR4_VESSQ